MGQKKKEKKPNRPQKKTNPKGKPKAAGTKHPEQKQAEREEEKTLQEKQTGKPKASETDLGESVKPDREPEQEQDAKLPSRKDMKKGELPIVAIGASAGGLQALETFFSEVPEDSGIAFVVITHTDPERESMLPDLIKKKSKIPVQVIEDGKPPEPNTAYLPPSNRDAVLEQKTFHLKERPGKSEIHMPVDLFLKHLAEEREELAGCVILSGTGTDGTLGLRLIKEKAGLAIAQSPDSARHTGMPKSAIETGMVDYVLTPAEMPERLIEYFKHPAAIPYEPEEKKAPDTLRQILTFLANRTRHDFSQYKENTLIRRIERRMAVTRSRNAADYLKILNRDPKEVRALFQDLLIGVTNFFRDPEAFAFLKEQVLPDLVSQEERETLRVWVPGCATGEEAYSVAIILQELIEEKEISRGIQVFGTDIDSRAIENARQGSYVQNIVSEVSPERLKRFFTKEDSRYRVKPDIRELVLFAEQNVLADPPFSKLDLLVCRNLLIYLKPEAQNRLIPLFHYSLREEGILFLGTSESVGRYHDIFESVSKQYSIYRKRNHAIRPQVQFPTAKKLERPGEELAAGKEPDQAQNVGRAAEKLLMEEHTPACVVVNQKGEILHFHGRTGKYLEPAPGEPTVQIADMAREGLHFPILTALRRASEDKGEVREKDVRVKTNHDYQRIDLVIKTFNEPPLKDCRIVIFEELPEPPEPKQTQKGRTTGEGDARRVEELELELMRVRQDYRSAIEELQTSNEELRSSNEELHSSNEELQSTNEELESSREELQSLNEELNTVNSELNSKIMELNVAYSAINSVLNSTRIAILFLDNDLKVKRFTPEASELLNLIDTDVGRPIDHISHNLRYKNLVEKTREVLKKLSSVDEEVQTQDGHWYHLRIMVYRPEEHVIEGVVLTFINIDEQKQVQKELQQVSERKVRAAKRFAENILDTVRESLLVLDSQMRVLTANHSFYETFRARPEETEGKHLFDLGNRQWDIPELRKLLEVVLQKNQTFQDYVVEHRFPEIGLKRMILNARMLHDLEGEENRILLAIEDVTKRKDVSGEKKT
jgi:two-component system CheB/CheR fusion protein